MAALDDEGTVGTNEDDLRLMRLWTMVLPLMHPAVMTRVICVDMGRKSLTGRGCTMASEVAGYERGSAVPQMLPGDCHMIL